MCDQHEGSRSRPLAEREGGMGGGREGGRDLREERSESRKGGAGGQGLEQLRAFAPMQVSACKGLYRVTGGCPDMKSNRPFYGLLRP